MPKASDTPAPANLDIECRLPEWLRMAWPLSKSGYLSLKFSTNLARCLRMCRATMSLVIDLPFPLPDAGKRKPVFGHLNPDPFSFFHSVMAATVEGSIGFHMALCFLNWSSHTRFLRKSTCSAFKRHTWETRTHRASMRNTMMKYFFLRGFSNTSPTTSTVAPALRERGPVSLPCLWKDLR